MRRLPRRILDFAVYIVIGLGLCAAALWYASNSDEGGADRFAKWGGLAVNTLLLYGYVIKFSRGYLRRRSFWLPLTLLLIAHLGAFAVVLNRVEHWKVLWFIAMYPIEIPIIAAICWRHPPEQPETGGVPQ